MSARKAPMCAVVWFCAIAALLLVASTAAMAAAPQAPGAVSVESVSPSGAVLRGVLNPGAEGEAGTYEFLYRKSGSECQGGSKTQTGLVLGAREEQVEERLSGLEPHSEYTVCLLARNLAGEVTVGPATTFTTTRTVVTPIADPATAITSTTARLNGVLNPGGEGEQGYYYFVYSESSTECRAGGTRENTAGFTFNVPGTEQPISSEITRLLPGTTYTFCVLAGSGSETVLSSSLTFTTQDSTPAIAEQSASGVGPDEATVSAQVDPGALQTSYRVEYGTSASYGSTTPAVSLPALSVPTSVQVRLTGLDAGVEYHFRFTAQNALGTTNGPDAGFTTIAAAGASTLQLPDERAYELVSEPNALGEVYIKNGVLASEEDLVTARPFRAATDGEAVAYVGDPPGTQGSGDSGQGEGQEYLARRSAQGWTSRDITPEPGEGQPFSFTIYEAFSSDLSVGFLSSEDPHLAAGADPPAPATCHGFGGLYSYTGGEGGYHSLFTSAGPLGKCRRPVFADYAPEASETAFETEAALTENAQPGAEGGNDNLYTSVDGELSLVNQLPSGEADPNATFGGPPAHGAPTPGGEEGLPPDFSNVLSSDGSRVFWTDLNTGHAYARERGTRTVPVSAGPARFWTATPDGRYAFYTEGEQLLRFDLDKFDASHKPEAEALAEAREQLTGPTAGVQGVIGTSEDGSYVYFVATGALTPGAKPVICERAPEATAERGEEEEGRLPPSRGCNLYLIHIGTSVQLTLVATLGALDDDVNEVGGDWQPGLGERTAEVTPDGHGLVFASTLPLTGYNITGLDDFNGGRHPQNGLEVFAYSADAGKLSCASCSPIGASPVPGALPAHLGISWRLTYMPRWTSADGDRVFFETGQPLVSQDTNGKYDVYEWEREGSASCPSRSPAMPDDGCVFLLSGGDSPDGSFFVDADAKGENVFFTTRGSLVSEDEDEKVNLYDARVHGGFPHPLLACTGTGCQGVPPGQPIFATPSSVTFGGVGNFEASSKVVVKRKVVKPKACKRGFVRRHHKCTRKKKAKKASRRSDRGRKS